MTISIDASGRTGNLEALFENASGRFQTVNRAAAAYLGVDEQDLRARIEGGDSLADIARAQGKSVDGLKDALGQALAGTTSDPSSFVDRIVDAHPGQRHAGGPHHRGGTHPDFAKIEQAVTDYLGLDPDSVRDELSSGKSLADIATEQGKSVDGLKSALVGALRTDQSGTATDGVLQTLVDHFVDNPGGASQGGRVSTLA